MTINRRKRSVMASSRRNVMGGYGDGYFGQFLFIHAEDEPETNEQKVIDHLIQNGHTLNLIKTTDWDASPQPVSQWEAIIVGHGHGEFNVPSSLDGANIVAPMQHADEYGAGLGSKPQISAYSAPVAHTPQNTHQITAGFTSPLQLALAGADEGGLRLTDAPVGGTVYFTSSTPGGTPVATVWSLPADVSYGRRVWTFMSSGGGGGITDPNNSGLAVVLAACRWAANL